MDVGWMSKLASQAVMRPVGYSDLVYVSGWFIPQERASEVLRLKPRVWGKVSILQGEDSKSQTEISCMLNSF